MTVGACVSALLAKILKRLIRQERPVHERQLKKSYGMPSTHSTAVIFLSTFATFIILYYAPSSLSPMLVALTIAASNMLGVSAALSRVTNGHHTLAQVAAGSCLGVVCASVWWALRDAFLPFIDQHIIPAIF
ncbi:hypothetical protein GGI02_001419 [Coemansia sp. RSA 2322]|uniref:Phosphatidic acid phosphatase type 2/haloperoxidase domain-containing protein n=1 Tax=Coemansia thaxteri TaxID=2663907 RepID=A0A9W8BA43_9FUNG|nr:hypothetical protein H4R26_004952 [Coemansia thaxteri]KAJ2472656.1 hypothetical protein GGI02_001419 [Coemansia sp. RSA 2322]